MQPLVVNHQSQFPSVTISYNLKPGYALGDSVKAIQQAQAGMGVPATVAGAFQGTAQAFQSLAGDPSRYLIAAALIAVYIILGILYQSYILPLTILSTLPSAGVGALLFLMAFGYELTVIAIVGIILLIGIVKKNGIMMVDFAIHAERNEGASPDDAIRQACLLRFRPILMTTMAALLSGLPLMLGSGAGSELRRPLGLRDGGRAGVEPGADAVHDAGGLSVSRQAAALARAGEEARDAGGGAGDAAGAGTGALVQGSNTTCTRVLGYRATPNSTTAPARSTLTFSQTSSGRIRETWSRSPTPWAWHARRHAGTWRT